MTVLILGFPRDIHIHAVRWAIEQAEGRHHTVYTPDLPLVLRSSMHITQTSQAVSVGDGRRHGVSGAWSTVWFRRSGLPMRPPGMSDADWAVTSRECDYHIRNVRQLIAPDAFWVNDIAAREVVLLKMPQLIAAAQCGFAIPETLYSNDPDEIRRFWCEHRKASVIFKLHLQTHWHAQERRAPCAFHRRAAPGEPSGRCAACGLPSDLSAQGREGLRTARHLHGRALRGHPSRLAVARFDAARLAIGYGGAAQAGACHVATHGRAAV